MAYRITRYEQAFEDVLGIKIDEKIKAFLKRMEREGHTEKSICFTIWKKQDKLLAFRRDSRFLGVLENEINKWSWKRDDPRWTEYWNRKKEEEKAVKIKKELDAIREDEKEKENMEKVARKPPKKLKGYVYFIQGQCGGAIKIGYSANPAKRLKELQTGYPDTLKILLMIPGSESTERTLHREFEASRLNGEWFRPDEYLLNRMKEIKAMYPEPSKKTGKESDCAV